MRPSQVFILSWSIVLTAMAAAYAAPSPSAAASPGASQNQPQKLPPVVVTATRIEQPIDQIGTTISVVEAPEIQKQQIEQVGNVLEQVPGVVVLQSGSPGTVTDVTIRGATSSQTLVLVDGVEVNTGATGAFDFANLTTDNLNRIEVLRGAGGALYGSQAIGGVVQLLSEEGEGAPKATITSEGGNRATQRQVATINGAQGNLGYSGSISYFSTQGFQKINDNSDNLAGAARLDYHLDADTTLRGFARYSRSNVSLADFTIFQGSLNPTAHQRTEFMLFKGEIEHRFGERLLARASASFVRNDLRLNFPPYPGNTGFEISEVDRTPDEIRGGLVEAVYTWAKGWRSLAGFDFKDRWVRIDDTSTFIVPPPSNSAFNERRQEYAGYVQQEGSFFDGRILGVAGFRADGNSQFGQEVSPAWSVAIPLKEISTERFFTTLRGSYSEGFRAPSFDELFFPFFGNPNLAPEISSEYDGGFTTTFGEWGSFTSTYFSRRVHNLIVTVPVPVSPANPFGSEAGNAGRVDVQGVEIVPSVGPFYGFSLSGGFTVLDETHSSQFGHTPLRVPKRSAYGIAQYNHSAVLLPSDKIALTLAYTFVGDREDITVAGGTANHDAYHRFDATATYDARTLWRFVTNEEVFTRVSNVFDRNYSANFGFPAPPVNFVAGIKLELE
jgi:vitamin B12 transporter